MTSSSSCLEQAVLTAVYLRCPSLKLLLVLIGRFYSDLLVGLHPGLLRTITDQIHLNVKDFFYFSLLHIMETCFLDIYINKMFPRMCKNAQNILLLSFKCQHFRLLFVYMTEKWWFREVLDSLNKKTLCAVCVLFQDRDVPCSVIFWYWVFSAIKKTHLSWKCWQLIG